MLDVTSSAKNEDIAQGVLVMVQHFASSAQLIVYGSPCHLIDITALNHKARYTLATKSTVAESDDISATKATVADAVDFVADTVEFVAQMSNILSTSLPVCTGPK